MTSVTIRQSALSGTLSVAQLTTLFNLVASGPVPSGLIGSASVLFRQYGINTPERIAEFLAEISHETGGFKRFEEDLRYSAAGMLKTWPSHFTESSANAAVGNPVAIASIAYEGRMGNGKYPLSIDGYTYRGRGLLQLTGKDQYAAYGQALGLDLVGHPELASDPAISMHLACEFCKRAKVFEAIDTKDYVSVRKRINGGTLGLDDVADRRKKLLGAIG